MDASLAERKAAARPAGSGAPPRLAGRARQALLMAAKLAVAGGILAYLFATGKIRPGDLSRVTPTALALALAAVAGNVLLAAVRWWVLLRAQAVDMGWRDALRFTLIGMFFNTFMPGAVGGDAFKVYYVAGHAPPGQKVEAGTTVLLDRVLGLFSIFLLVGLAIATQGLLGGGDALREITTRLCDRLGALRRPLAIVGAAAALGGAALAHPAGREALRSRLPGAAFAARFLGTFVRAARSRRALLAALLASCASHACTILAFFVIGRALGDRLDLGRYLLLVPIGLMVQAIPGPPGGLGIGEAAFETLFALASGASSSLGGAMCMIWHAVIFAVNLLGGVAYVLHRRSGVAPPVLESRDRA
jgi:uncharacterized membrane protein YbhN (UPF0104 family)